MDMHIAPPDLLLQLFTPPPAPLSSPPPLPALPGGLTPPTDSASASPSLQPFCGQHTISLPSTACGACATP
eukprot:3220085-Pleurochrysis_carterae.AAC.1